MPKAHEVAAELIKLAVALNKEPETTIARPLVLFSNSGDKQQFLNTARLMPRPFIKEFETCSYPYLRLIHKTDAIHIDVSIPRSQVCEVLEPAREAVYYCPGIFTAEEEAELEAAQ